MRSCALAAAALVAMLEVARADGLPSHPTYGCCGSPTWSGVYAGFQAGGAWGDTGWTSPFLETYNTTPGQHVSTNPAGAVVGGQFGINQQFGGVVFGGELSFAGTSMHETLRPATFAQDRFKTAISNLLTVTGRAGLPLGNHLLYGKAGYANANVALGAFSGAPVPGITADASRREVASGAASSSARNTTTSTCPARVLRPPRGERCRGCRSMSSWTICICTR